MTTTEFVEYRDEQGLYEGMLITPEGARGQLPCVLVFPTVWGRTSMEEQAAKDLAERGYVAFIVDLYGKGFDASTEEAAFGRMDEYNEDRRFLLSRLELVYNTVQAFDLVDENNIAAIGYCFGGKCVLDLARSGLEYAGGVSFHGVLNPPDFNTDVTVKTPLVILHGWDDPLATPDDVLALSKELTEKGANWELVSYGHTGHAFMKPEANNQEGGYFYHAEMAERAWQRTVDFLAIKLAK